MAIDTPPQDGRPIPAPTRNADAPGPAGPPMRADARRNRARVLEVAQEAFASAGLQVGLDEIAKRAGVGAGTVYRHFPTKESLFDAVILHRAQSLVDRARELANEDDPGRAFFGFVAQMNRESAAKRDLIDAVAGIGVDITSNLTEVNRELWAAVEVLMNRAQTAGSVRRDVGITHLKVLLRAVFIANDGVAAGPEVADKVMVVICDGMGADPARTTRAGSDPS
jgi:AcrR family transcriptional regulator